VCVCARMRVCSHADTHKWHVALFGAGEGLCRGVIQLSVLHAVECTEQKY